MSDHNETSDIRVIACNYREGTGVASEGALAYLVGYSNGDGFERRIFLVRSRGGRWVRKWEPTARMTNWRYKTIPPEKPVYRRLKDEGGPEMANRVGPWLIEGDGTRMADTLADTPP